MRTVWIAALVAIAGCPSEEEGSDGETGTATDPVTTTVGMSTTMAPGTSSGPETTTGGGGSTTTGGTTSGSESGSSSSSSSSGGATIECEWFEQPDTGREWGLCTPAAEWQEAEDHCVAEGGHLVSVDGQPDSIFAINVLGATAEAWIGLNDLQREGTWVWTDGTAFGYENWEDKQPDNPDHHCVAIGTARRWFDYSCGESRPFICARPV